MHSVTLSATSRREDRRLKTADEITREARELADQHGLDGFTMDQLADAVGVSRRTVFNYFGTKLDAVLGRQHHPDQTLVDTFRAGGPTGDLIDDLQVMVTALIDAKPLDNAGLMQMHRLIRNEPKIVHAAHERMVKDMTEFAVLVQDREGSDFDPAAARLLGRVVLAAFDEAMEAFAADPIGPSLQAHIGAGFTRRRTLFGPPAAH